MTNNNASSVPTVPYELTPFSVDKTQQYNTEDVNKCNTFHALSCPSQHSYSSKFYLGR